MSSDPLSRYSVSSSNIERILSRYRPIAPKPTNTCSSTVSASASTSTEQLLQPVPLRRTTGSGKRKRISEPAATDMCQSSKISQRSSGVGGGGGHRSIRNPLNHGIFCVNNNNNNNNNCPAISSPDLFGDSLVQTCTKLDSGGSTLEKPSLRSSWSSSYNNNNNNNNNNTSSSNNHNNNNNYSIKNSNSNSNSSNNNNNNNNNNSNSVGKGFFQMIRGITCLPSTADVHALLTPRISTNTVINEELLSVCSKSSDLNNNNNNNNNNNSNSPVTLSLFPETPLPNQSKKPAKTVENMKPFSCSPTLIEKPHDVEKAYGSSSDPMLLVDDKGVVVWTNTAYEKSYKSAMDSPISSSSVYIDPLGIPTQLAEFRLASSGKVFTLWGFLKRLVGIGEASGQISPISSCNNGGAREIPGFSLSLERITEIKSSSSSLSSSALLRGSGLQEAQLHASSLSCPAFITEANKQQKLVWNNPAFEKIVDHVSRHAGDNSKAIKGMGIMSTANYLVSGVAIPASISSFSGCLNLQWISVDSRREKRTMTIPCDVIRVGGRKREADEAGLFIWKLDVAACLRLCCS